MPTPEVAAALAYKVAGAFIGSLFALVLIPPRSLKEFASRAMVSVVSGYVFAPTVLYYLKLPGENDHSMAAATLVGVASWWALGAVISFARRWRPKI